MSLRLVALVWATLAMGLGGCVSIAAPPAVQQPEQGPEIVALQATPETKLAPPTPRAVEPPAVPSLPKPLEPAAEPAAVELAMPARVATVQVEEPRYLPPESLKRFRYAKPPAAAPQSAKSTSPTAQIATNTTRSGVDTRQRGTESTDPSGPAVKEVELPKTAVVAVTTGNDQPRYAPPDSLKQWGSGRKVPLYADTDAAPWQATPSEPRLQNAAVSCNYKDEGGVRGKVMLLVNDHKVTRFTARIEMPNGGICQFDSKNMRQRPFEQGLALEAKDDDCVVRMWEQKHRITVAAYSCDKQCSRGSFSYLWPILMDTRIGTCY